ncbi:hypothetical protein ARMGADRAFT_1161860 [Armillaria gallica]|uniref:Uncharacterized protein n=1 Tax=Armillaria gallica TaxID=47427 RepID=A0A2H3EDJ2_ARMGA|nr:hypothetical protein ARMGADRAFT_1161860 [Armillaria gallica]
MKKPPAVSPEFMLACTFKALMGERDRYDDGSNFYSLLTTVAYIFNHCPSDLGENAERTVGFWRSHTSRCRYSSGAALLTLSAISFPTGLPGSQDRSARADMGTLRRSSFLSGLALTSICQTPLSRLIRKPPPHALFRLAPPLSIFSPNHTEEVLN